VAAISTASRARRSITIRYRAVISCIRCRPYSAATSGVVSSPPTPRPNRAPHAAHAIQNCTSPAGRPSEVVPCHENILSSSLTALHDGHGSGSNIRFATLVPQQTPGAHATRLEKRRPRRTMPVRGSVDSLADGMSDCQRNSTMAGDGIHSFHARPCWADGSARKTGLRFVPGRECVSIWWFMIEHKR